VDEWKIALVFSGVALGRQRNLFQLIGALSASSRFANLLNCGEQQSDEYSDDGDYEQKFEQGEGYPSATHDCPFNALRLSASGENDAETTPRNPKLQKGQSVDSALIRQLVTGRQLFAKQKWTRHRTKTSRVTGSDRSQVVKLFDGCMNRYLLLFL
jgi:hypothetical protein